MVLINSPLLFPLSPFFQSFCPFSAQDDATADETPTQKRARLDHEEAMDYENNFFNNEQYDNYNDNAPLTPPRDKNATTNNNGSSSSSSTQQPPAPDHENLPLSQLAAGPPAPPPDDDDEDAPLVKPSLAAVALSTT